MRTNPSDRHGIGRGTANSHVQSTWQPRPQATIIRGGEGRNYPTGPNSGCFDQPGFGTLLYAK
ncbi:hypothetical protein [Streptomyces sp. NPDC005408]|uniref:hypothetical protein n=1 Tax=Streptomyces sp. NPDC005408 TaxID=3155341 RepID=UPI0033A36853